MATRFELRLDGGVEASARAAGEAACREIEEVEARLSRFRRDSAVARLAESGALGSAWTRDEIALLELCRRAHRTTSGAFDPAWAGGGFTGVRIDRRARRVFARAGSPPLDLGGVGKGHALDRAVTVLRGSGIGSALLHGGTSSVAAIGAPADGSEWRVGLRDPFDAGILATVALRDRALSVSGPHGARREGETRPGHVVDPADGVPVERVRLAAVVARHGAVAEIASTALLVLAERALRAGAPVTAASLRIAPSITALLAWEDGGRRVVRVLGCDRARFAVRGGRRRAPRLEEMSR